MCLGEGTQKDTGDQSGQITEMVYAPRNSKRPATELEPLERGENDGEEEATQDVSWETEGTDDSIRRGLERVASGRRGKKQDETVGVAPQTKKRPPRRRSQSKTLSPKPAQPRPAVTHR